RERQVVDGEDLAVPLGQRTDRDHRVPSAVSGRVGCSWSVHAVCHFVPAEWRPGPRVPVRWRTTISPSRATATMATTMSTQPGVLLAAPPSAPRPASSSVSGGRGGSAIWLAPLSGRTPALQRYRDMMSLSTHIA